MRNFCGKILYCGFSIIIFGIISPILAIEYLSEPPQISTRLIKNTKLNINDIENLIKENLQLKNTVIYHRVPRGLIVSFDSSLFFEDNAEELKESSKQLLTKLGELIKTIDEPCVIEGHTTRTSLKDSTHIFDWEISMIRAEKILDYLIKNTNVDPKKTRAIGFGKKIPDEIFHKENSRIDFVILIYPQ